MTDQQASRRGNILVMAVILLGAAMALVVQSSESVTSSHTWIKLRLWEQKTLAAAEAVAAREEANLSDNFFEINRLNSNFTQNYGQLWFGDCQVKWRIEPAVVTEAKDPATAGTKYIENPDPDPNAPIPSQSSDQQLNEDIYHYRIATEATYSEKNSMGQDVVRCRAQAVRLVQMSAVRLFKYAIFYGQKGAKGDCEFAHGPDLTVLGGVHSNGAIYMGGSGSPANNTIDAVSSGGATTIGNPAKTGKKVTVTGVDGVFIMNKRYNYYHQGGAGYPSTPANGKYAPDPMKITDTKLFNTQTNRTINNVAMTKDKDSRGDKNFSTNSTAAAPTGWGGWVRTSKTGAAIVESLANIPEFAGRPLEPHKLSTKDAGGKDIVNEKDRQTICYVGPPQNVNTIQTGNPVAANAQMKYAANGAYLNYALGQKECGGTGWSDLTAVADGYAMHLEAYDNTTGSSRVIVPAKVGLIIRERPLGPFSINEVYDTEAVPTVDLKPTDKDAYALAKANYVIYMSKRYQVFMGRLDITQEFFGYPSYTQSQTDRWIVPAGIARSTATQDFFYNQREYYSQGTKKWSDKSIQRQNVLTLNMDALQDFLRDTRLEDISAFTAANGTDPKSGNAVYLSNTVGGPVADKTDTLRMHFSGLIYAHRTNRDIAGTAPEDFSAAIRIRYGKEIKWDHNAGNNPLGTSKMTIVTPNQVFLCGDFNTTTYPTGQASPNDMAQPPLALMCDMVTVQSNNWNDDNQNKTAVFPKVAGGSDSFCGASSTTYNVALVVNNAPTTHALKNDDASVHTFAWYMENWGGTDYRYKGSIVVLNNRRYCRGFNAGNTRLMNSDKDANGNSYPRDIPPDLSDVTPTPTLYGAPTRYITFNEDLMSNDGTPPYVLPAYQISRQVAYSYVVMVR